MQWGVIDQQGYLDAANIEELRGMDFVFLCLDKGSAKKVIVEKLEEFNSSFTDVGMGIQLTDQTLGGIVRVTTSTANMRDHFRGRVSFGEAAGDNEYDRNIQIADLNALNASLAVIKWKKQFGFYRDLKSEHHSQISIDGNLLLNEDRPQLSMKSYSNMNMSNSSPMIWSSRCITTPTTIPLYGTTLS